MTSNNISGPGLCALADSMENNMTLNNIYIWGNNLEEPACDVSTVNPVNLPTFLICRSDFDKFTTLMDVLYISSVL